MNHTNECATSHNNAHWPTELIEATGNMTGFRTEEKMVRQLKAWQAALRCDYRYGMALTADDHEAAVGFAVAELTFDLSRLFDMAAAANVAVELAAHTNLGKVEA